MKVILFGAAGTIGKEVRRTLEEAGHEIVTVGRKSGDFQADITSRDSLRALYKKLGSFDAVVNASGEVAFAPLADLNEAEWKLSLGSKLMGQINLVQEALPFINEKGSFTLVSGVLSEEPILAGVAATTVNRAIEGFAAAAAAELPKSLRINVVSPTVLKESEKSYGPFFPGFIPVEGWKVAQAFKKSVMGIQNGQVFKVS